MNYAWPLLALTGFATFVVASLALGRWLLGPVNRAAGRLNAPTRFVLTDIVWLMVQLQLVLGLVMMYLRDTIPLTPLLVILGAWCLMVIVLWGASVSVVSRAGITQPLRRAAVILVLVPGSLAEIMAVPFFIVGAIVVLTPGTPGWLYGLISDDPVSRVAGLIAAVTGAVVAACLIRWLSFWVLATPARPGQLQP